MVNNRTNDQVYDISLTHWVDTFIDGQDRLEDIEDIRFVQTMNAPCFNGIFSHDHLPFTHQRNQTAIEFVHTLKQCGYVLIGKRAYFRHKQAILSLYQHYHNLKTK